jgi:hypothetical protein
VDYYSQILGENSALNGQMVNRSSVNQSYKKIKNVILRVTSALSQSQSEEDKGMDADGSANMYPGIIPNEGDMFIGLMM